jgi:hypothetical protein
LICDGARNSNPGIRCIMFPYYFQPFLGRQEFRISQGLVERVLGIIDHSLILSK